LHLNATPLLPMSRHSPLKSPSWKPAFLTKKIGSNAIKKRLKDTSTAFAPVVAALCDATEAAAAVIPEAHELNSFLLSVATEVDIVIEYLLRELQRQTEAVRANHAALDLPQSVNDEPEPPKNNDRLLLLPAWLRRNQEVEKKEQRRIGSARQLDLTVKRRDPNTPIRVALDDFRCPRCNSHGRTRIAGLACYPSI
jgi:hypothetical protein